MNVEPGLPLKPRNWRSCAVRLVPCEEADDTTTQCPGPASRVTVAARLINESHVEAVNRPQPAPIKYHYYESCQAPTL